MVCPAHCSLGDENDANAKLKSIFYAAAEGLVRPMKTAPGKGVLFNRAGHGQSREPESTLHNEPAAPKPDKGEGLFNLLQSPSVLKTVSSY